jgi:hypothetical protein
MGEGVDIVYVTGVEENRNRFSGGSDFVCHFYFLYMGIANISTPSLIDYSPRLYE